MPTTTPGAWMCALHWDPAETPRGDWHRVVADTSAEAAAKFAYDCATAYGHGTHALLDVYVIEAGAYERFRREGRHCVAVKYDCHVLPPKGS